LADEHVIYMVSASVDPDRVPLHLSLATDLAEGRTCDAVRKGVASQQLLGVKGGHSRFRP
jgi:hypothetical protein